MKYVNCRIAYRARRDIDSMYIIWGVWFEKSQKWIAVGSTWMVYIWPHVCIIKMCLKVVDFFSTPKNLFTLFSNLFTFFQNKSPTLKHILARIT